jgi:methionine biosynthesis protein MetW
MSRKPHPSGGEGALRSDFAAIEALVPQAARVLELGCGDGTLLHRLVKQRKITARGVEISEENVAACVARGLSVFQGDVDEGLENYRDQSFDLVMMVQTLQVVYEPHKVLREMLRVGKQVLITFPNFGHFSVRLALLLRGRMPMNKLLPYNWYETPNIHHLTIADFRAYCRQHALQIEVERALTRRPGALGGLTRLWPNLFAGFGLFIIREKNRPAGQEPAARK